MSNLVLDLFFLEESNTHVSSIDIYILEYSQCQHDYFSKYNKKEKKIKKRGESKVYRPIFSEGIMMVCWEEKIKPRSI